MSNVGCRYRAHRPPAPTCRMGRLVVRVGVVSHTYIEGENRKKLHALARAGHDVTVFVPARWTEGMLGKSWITTPERAAGIRICPVSVKRLRRSPATESSPFLVKTLHGS